MSSLFVKREASESGNVRRGWVFRILLETTGEQRYSCKT
jgi:hypothetical protein